MTDDIRQPVITAGVNGLRDLVQIMIVTDDINPADVGKFRGRWKTAAGQLLQQEIRHAFANGHDMPTGLDTVDVTLLSGKSLTLVDLRGIDLSHLVLHGKLDLAYVCLDFSDCRHTFFDETSLQFSCCRYGEFDDSVWKAVQGSPMSGYGACFTRVRNSNSHLLMSDLRESRHISTVYNRVALCSSCLTGSVRDKASRWTQVDEADCIGQIVVLDTQTAPGRPGKVPGKATACPNQT